MKENKASCLSIETIETFSCLPSAAELAEIYEKSAAVEMEQIDGIAEVEVKCQTLEGFGELKLWDLEPALPQRRKIELNMIDNARSI